LEDHVKRSSLLLSSKDSLRPLEQSAAKNLAFCGQLATCSGVTVDRPLARYSEGRSFNSTSRGIVASIFNR
jgi:hypothetical protein